MADPQKNQASRPVTKQATVAAGVIPLIVMATVYGLIEWSPWALGFGLATLWLVLACCLGWSESRRG